jgi:hypothetical protein
VAPRRDHEGLTTRDGGITATGSPLRSAVLRVLRQPDRCRGDTRSSDVGGAVAVEVVLDGPHLRPAAWTAARGVGFVVGSVLRVIGLTAVFPVLAMTYAAAIWIFDRDQDMVPNWVVPLWLVSAVATWLACRWGARLRTGSRRAVLYLRRFGHVEASRTVTAAVTRIGAHWRVLTLDDGHVSPLGVRGANAVEAAARLGRHGEAVMSGITRSLRAVATLAAWAVVAVVGITAVQAVRDNRDPVTAVLHRLGDRRALAYVTDHATAIVVVVAVLGVGLVVRVAVNLFASATGALGEHVRAAERATRLRIDDEQSLKAARILLGARVRRVVSARMCVLTVDSRVWRTTVVTLGADAAIPLIDITEPTGNILWEVDRMREAFGPAMRVRGPLRTPGTPGHGFPTGLGRVRTAAAPAGHTGARLPDEQRGHPTVHPGPARDTGGTRPVPAREEGVHRGRPGRRGGRRHRPGDAATADGPAAPA